MDRMSSTVCVDRSLVGRITRYEKGATEYGVVVNELPTASCVLRRSICPS